MKGSVHIRLVGKEDVGKTGNTIIPGVYTFVQIVKRTQQLLQCGVSCCVFEFYCILYLSHFSNSGPFPDWPLPLWICSSPGNGVWALHDSERKACSAQNHWRVGKGKFGFGTVSRDVIAVQRDVCLLHYIVTVLFYLIACRFKQANMYDTNDEEK